MGHVGIFTRPTRLVLRANLLRRCPNRALARPTGREGEPQGSPYIAVAPRARCSWTRVGLSARWAISVTRCGCVLVYPRKSPVLVTISRIPPSPLTSNQPKFGRKLPAHSHVPQSRDPSQISQQFA